MKSFFFLFIATILFISCQKNPESKETIQQDDLMAASAMTSEVSIMQQSLNNLVAAPNQAQRLYWDSAYHRHDSLFWHHHNIYHHGTYQHDDHSHQWVPYNPGINHHGHHHPHYPGHLNDSLIIVASSIHHHTNCDHHPGHHICHHHTINSIHQLHNVHHP